MAKKELTDKQLCNKIAKILKKWKDDDHEDFDDFEAASAIDDLLNENGYNTGDYPDSWETW